MEGKVKWPDFGKMPALRLIDIPRWSIIKMSRQENVAEHSFQVAVIVKRIGEIIGLQQIYINELVFEAVFHDECEIKSGDIPTPFKQEAEIDDGGPELSPIVKLADLIQAYRFARIYLIDNPSTYQWLTDGLEEKIYTHINKHDRFMVCSTELNELLTEGI